MNGRNPNRPPTPPRARRASRARQEERPQVRHVFAAELRVGAEIHGEFVEKLEHYRRADGEFWGYKYFIRTDKGPILLYSTDKLDRILLQYQAGDKLHLVYQGTTEFFDDGEKKIKVTHLWDERPPRRRR